MLLVASLPGVSAQAITQAQVDEACAESQEAYDTYQTSRSEFEDAALALEAANADLAQAEDKEQRIQAAYNERQSRQTELRSEIEVQAVDLYMQRVSGFSTASPLLLSSPSQALTAFEFLKSSTDQNLQTSNDLVAVTSELDRLGIELEAAVAERTTIRDAQEMQTASQETAMTSALAAYDQLGDRCKQLQADYEAEQARLRAEEEARRKRETAQRERASEGSSGSGSSGVTVGGIICPFTPGRTHFINSWGFPRSGGRNHTGTDMFAPWDEPVFAVATGSVSTGNGGIGGKTIWLTANNGTRFYYAHLSDFAVQSGQAVEQGQLIGYNGNSGNASGSAPHVHFSIRPSGRSAINPYPTVASVCF